MACKCACEISVAKTSKLGTIKKKLNQKKDKENGFKQFTCSAMNVIPP